MKTHDQVMVLLADLFTPPSLGMGADQRVDMGMMHFNKAGDYVSVSPRQIADALLEMGLLVPDGTVV